MNAPVAALAVRRAIPALGALIVIAVLGGIALRIGSDNLAVAERTRFASRVHTIDGLKENAEDASDAESLSDLVQRTPFAPDDPAGNAALLASLRTGEDAGVVALIDRSGELVAAQPDGSALTAEDLGGAWDEALSGRAATSDVIDVDGRTAVATLVPIGEPSPWAVVVVTRVADGSVGQAFFEQLGSLNGAPGGFAVVDRRGVAYNAWSADRLGTAVLTPQEVAALSPDEVSGWTALRDGVEHSYAGIELRGGFGLVFDQETDLLYGDLREAERGRNRTLVVLLVIAVGGVAGTQYLRERTARREEARVRALLRNSQDLVLVTTETGVLGFVSPAIEGLLGHDARRWVGRPLRELAHEAHRDVLDRLLAEPGRGPLHDVELLAADGTRRWFDVEARDLRDDPDVGGILLTCHEVGARKELQDELLHQTTHDRLTGLPNRPLLGQRLDELLAAGPVRSVALLYIDLDRFKPVNDTLGHDAGDAVLETVARRLRAVAGPAAWPARLGGDEFVVVAEGMDEDAARQLAEALRTSLRAPIAVGTNIVHIDASVGLAVVRDEDDVLTADQLIRIGDEAMYEAKRLGRGSVVAASEEAFVAPPPLSVHVVPSAAVDGCPSAQATTEEETRSGPPGPTGGPAASRRLVASAPVVVAALLVALIGWFGLRQTDERRVAAEEERVEQQSRFVVRAAAFYSDAYAAEHLTGTVTSAPWSLDGGPVDAAVLEAFATSDRMGEGATALLLSPGGDVVASFPADHPAAVGADHPAWPRVLDGHAQQLASVADADTPRSYYLVPIEREGEVAGVLALGLSLRDGPSQAALQQGGSSGQPNGGWSLLSADGRVYASWDPDLIGTQLADPADLAEIEVDDVADLSSEGTFAAVSPMTSSYERTYLAFSVPEDEFFADLRVGTTRRDLSYGGVLAATILGLAVSNHRRERAVRRSEARLTALLRNAHDLILVLDGRGDVRFISSAVEHLLGYPPGFRLGSGLIDLVHPDDRDRIVDLLVGSRRSGAGGATDIRVEDAAGRWRWFDVHASDLRHHAEVRGLLLTCHDVTVRHGLQERLREQSRRDPLTGLPNRRRLGESLEELSVGIGERFAVLFVDLDDFKPVNDTLGHDAGDEVLRVIATRFDDNVRSRPGGRPDDLVCRLGGDEFAILLRDVDDAAASVVADRLTEVAAAPIDVGGREVRVSASIGVALSHPASEDPTAAVQRADQAMYRAKATAPGSYAVTSL
ncbi:diguanylate cyclase domain-containing protein [Actinomarinicola tropica]|uniref:Diguanylate cyclase n=1 Tax=Actinomarinicola tropica TaxID=2789776 RepID=A0A5Q2RN23_9ACTN|nr:diguanylate cyclase [Actinomarinicola tropica]QGG95300.1 diguanylate cyclase [Actinomarinicola tropica]